jgi:hypothetical protein
MHARGVITVLGKLKTYWLEKSKLTSATKMFFKIGTKFKN